MRCSTPPVTPADSSGERCGFRRSPRAGGQSLRGAAAKPGCPPWRDGQCGSGPCRSLPRRRRPGFARCGSSRIDHEAPGRDLVVAAADRREPPHDSARRASSSCSACFPTPDGPPLFRSYSLSGPSPPSSIGSASRWNPTAPGERYLSGSVRVRRRRSRRQRPEGQLHAATGRRPGGAAERGNRRDAGARHAARPGGERIASRGLVAPRRSQRELTFICRGGAAASRLARGRSHIWYSRPDADDRVGRDYDATGRLTVEDLERLHVPRERGLLPLRPSTFMAELAGGLSGWGVARGRDPFRGLRGSAPALTPGVVATPARPPHQPAGTPGTGPLVSFARSGLSVRWRPSDDRACSSWRKRVTCPSGGRAARASATTARAD